MGYEEAKGHLDALGIDVMKSMRPSMHRIEAICEALNHPERSIPAIHVTGTNGKTSTARLATSILSATGLNVGTYTSPHLQTMRERIALNGDSISKQAFGDVFDYIIRYVEIVESELGESLTYFELMTAIFFLWAAEQPVDAAVVEVGLGGRWDATNVLPAPVAVITNVGLDHTGLLGTERETIAREKSGIIKPGSVVVTGERAPGVLQVIEEEAAVVGAESSVLDRDFFVTDNRVAFGGRYLSIRTHSRSYEGLFVPLHGGHQGFNAAVGLEATARFLHAPLDIDVANEGLSAAMVPGRLETMRGPNENDPTVVLDVAHNPDGMSALVTSLIEAFAFDKVTFVVGVLGDKDYNGMLAEIARVPCELVVTQPTSVRSVSPDDLSSAAAALGLEATIVDDVADALKSALSRTERSGMVCVTGSHYVVGEARSFLIGGEG